MLFFYPSVVPNPHESEMDMPIHSRLSRTDIAVYGYVTEKSKERIQRIHSLYSDAKENSRAAESEGVERIAASATGDSGYSSVLGVVVGSCHRTLTAL